MAQRPRPRPSPEVARSRRALHDAFRRIVVPELRLHGFKGREGHYARRGGEPAGEVIQVVELQLSIYGGRVTANLGLDLPWLPPAVRWIPPPAIGPHAHDAARWIRVGLTGPKPEDRWWTFLSDAEEEQLDAVRGLGAAILGHGIPWLEAESERRAFLRHARERLEYSKSPSRPMGRFLELRLLAAVLAWNGKLAEAREVFDVARASWEDERARLVAAERQLNARYPAAGEGRAPPPDLLGELEAVLARPACKTVLRTG